MPGGRGDHPHLCQRGQEDDLAPCRTAGPSASHHTLAERGAGGGFLAPRDPELWKQHLALHPPSRACHHLRTGGCVAKVATVPLCLPSLPSQKKKPQTQRPALVTRHGKSQAPDCRGGDETSPKVPPPPVPRGTRAPAGDPEKLFPCRLAAGVSSQTCSPSGAP